MVWKTLKELVQQGKDRRSLQRAAQSGRIPAYKTNEGKWLIWKSDSPSDLVQLFSVALAETREEIQKLRKELESLKKPAIQNGAASRPPPKEGEGGLPPAPLRISPSKKTDRDQLLRLIESIWSGSDAELERLAGAPRGWICRQRKFSQEGKSTSKRGETTRQKLLSYLKEKKAA